MTHLLILIDFQSFGKMFFLSQLHHSYTEPIGFHLKHTVFGFYWQGWDKVSNIFGACSIRMLLDVYDKQPYNLRNAPNAMENNVLGVALYKYVSSSQTII